MDRPRIATKAWIFFLILLLLCDQVGCKRGGGVVRSRGSSGARTGSRGGIFGGSSSANRGGVFGNTGTRTGINNGGFSSSGFGRATNNNKGTFSSGSSSGGVFGRTSGSGSRFSKGSGVGSVLRSNQFKNAIVGAAGAYLTYQAGKAIIRNAMTPMMWNNRPYYWGSNYYRGGGGNTMCRMPLDESDSVLGNVHFSDNTRPREIVWGCSYYEHCCGYECCRSSGTGGYGYGAYGGFGLGSLLLVILSLCCTCYIIRRYCMQSGNYIRGRETV